MKLFYGIAEERILFKITQTRSHFFPAIVHRLPRGEKKEAAALERIAL